MALVDDIVTHMQRRHVYGAHQVMPRLLVPIAGHALNLRNRGYVLDIDGDVEWEPDARPIYRNDLRSHLFTIGPPGTGKNFLWNQMFDEDIGIFAGKVPTHRIGKATDAGFVGGKMKQSDGTAEWEPGLFWTKQNAMIFSAEFSAVLQAAKTTHSNTIITTLLDALDNGFVGATQLGADKSYETRATLIAATQPGRFENQSGFDRRFIFYRLSLPTPEARYAFKKASLDHEHWTPDYESISALRERAAERLALSKSIKRIRLDEKLREWIALDEKIPIDLRPTITRAIIAYWFLDAPNIEPDFVIPDKSYLRDFGKVIVESRNQVLGDDEVYEFLLGNHLSVERTVATMRDEGVGGRIGKARLRKLVEASVEAYPHTLRYVTLKPENGPGGHMRIPTGLTGEQLLGFHPGRTVARDDLEDETE